MSEIRRWFCDWFWLYIVTESLWSGLVFWFMGKITCQFNEEIFITVCVEAQKPSQNQIPPRSYKWMDDDDEL